MLARALRFTVARLAAVGGRPRFAHAAVAVEARLGICLHVALVRAALGIGKVFDLDELFRARNLQDACTAGVCGDDPGGLHDGSTDRSPPGSALSFPT